MRAFGPPGNVRDEIRLALKPKKWPLGNEQDQKNELSLDSETKVPFHRIKKDEASWLLNTEVAPGERKPCN